MLLLFLAVDTTTSNNAATLIGAIAGLVAAIAALASALRRFKRKDDDDSDDAPPTADPFVAVRAEIASLNSALSTKDDEANDLRGQLSECRRDRDRHKNDAELTAGRLALALTTIGDRDGKIAELKQQLREAST